MVLSAACFLRMLPKHLQLDRDAF